MSSLTVMTADIVDNRIFKFKVDRKLINTELCTFG